MYHAASVLLRWRGGEGRGGEERGGEEILGRGSQRDDYHQEVNVAETMVICMAFDTLEQAWKKDKLRAHTHHRNMQILPLKTKSKVIFGLGALSPRTLNLLYCPSLQLQLMLVQVRTVQNYMKNNGQLLLSGGINYPT